jgi:hypothetical protein
MTTYQSTAYRVRQLFSTLAAAAASNPVLLEGEKWNEKDPVTGRATGRTKIGDGVVSADRATITGTAFNDLPFDPGGSGVATPSDLVRIDAASISTAYVGRAPVGTSESSSGWVIKRRTFSAAGVLLTTRTASGAWTNRASLTYT